MGVRRVSESETEYKFHLCFHFPSELVNRDERPSGIVNDITNDNHETSVHLSCDNDTKYKNVRKSMVEFFKNFENRGIKIAGFLSKNILIYNYFI